MTDRLLKVGEVVELTGLSESSIYNLMRQNLFPRSLKVGPQASRWSMAELEAWMRSRPRYDREAAAVS